MVAGLSLGITNALKTFNDADLTLCVSQTQMSYLSMEVSIDGEGTRFHFFISETKRDFD